MTTEQTEQKTSLPKVQEEEQHSVTILHESNFKSIEAFTRLLNEAPPAKSVQKTPDGKALYLPISHVEARLDEVYLRNWGTEDFEWRQLGNEILMTITLWVVDPITRERITRTGCAAIQITVDAVPDDIKAQGSQARNAWALDMQNKKPNAMMLAFPKGKSMAIKNAALSLGVKFGRNLNRKFEDIPDEFYTNLQESATQLGAFLEDLSLCETMDGFKALWALAVDFHENDKFKMHFQYWQTRLAKKLKSQENAK